LIIVGVFMMKSATRIAWDDMEQAIPAFLTIAMMPFAYSISDGVAFGFISYVIIKAVRAIILAIVPDKTGNMTAGSKLKEIPVLMWIISIMFIVMYVLKDMM
jgi:Permeases